MRILSEGQHQLTRELVGYGRDKIAAHAARRLSATAEKWARISSEMKAHIKSAFPMHKRWASGEQPPARIVSHHAFDDYRIENVLFESMPGWEVNATVYLPKQPGRYPGVVCPTGHSSKVKESYQVAAQVFARNGYVAVSFDPPGCAGEMIHNNDHFTNGLIGYLTGIWSNTHFVFDALACLDYLETRDDVDASLGFTVTGVSGGGATSMYASLLDERIRFVAPVCCIAEHESIHFSDLYTSCPEQFGPGFIKLGIDFIDLLAIQAPKPCLVVGGKLDEVFDYRSTERIGNEVGRLYELSGAADHFGLFLQSDSGHAYTSEMAAEVVRWMNRIILGQHTDAKPLSRADLVLADESLLLCHPENTANMYTINRDEGRALLQARTAAAALATSEASAMTRIAVRKQLQALLGLEESDLPNWSQPAPVPRVANEQPPVWSSAFTETVLDIAPGVQVPGLLARRVRSGLVTTDLPPAPGMLFIDEAGKWSGFHRGAVLSRTAGVLSREPHANEPTIFSIDVSGYGDLRPQPVYYDVVSWNSIERILAYLGIAAGRPLIGLQVRDALHAWHYLISRDDIDSERLVLAGRGSGALVAMLASLFVPRLERLILWDGLLHYQTLTEQFPFDWPMGVVLPNVLCTGDLQEWMPLVPCASENKVILNPRDAMRDLAETASAQALYGEHARVLDAPEGRAAEEVFRQVVYGEA